MNDNTLPEISGYISIIRGFYTTSLTGHAVNVQTEALAFTSLNSQTDWAHV